MESDDSEHLLVPHIILNALYELMHSVIITYYHTHFTDEMEWHTGVT